MQIKKPNQIVLSLAIFAVFALGACGDKERDAQVTASASSVPGPNVAQNKLNELHRTVVAPTLFTFTVVAIREYAEMVAAPHAPKNPELVGLMERVVTAVRKRAREGATSRVEPTDPSIQALDLAGQGAYGGAKLKAAEVQDQATREALEALFAAHSDQGDAKLALAKLEGAAKTAPGQVLRRMSRGVSALAQVEDIGLWAKVTSAMTASDDLSVGQILKDASQFGFFAQALDGIPRLRNRYYFVVGESGASAINQPLGSIFREVAYSAWNEVFLQERKGLGAAAVLSPKGEFETSVQFSERKVSHDTAIREAIAQLKSERPGKLREAMGRSFKAKPSWKLEKLKYDADLSAFNGVVQTFSGGVSIPVVIKVNRENAQAIKEGLDQASVALVLDADESGVLIVKRLVANTSNFIAIADVDWNTGIPLAEDAAKEYWALVDDASKHDAILRAHQQEQQKMREAERQVRLAEQKRAEAAAIEKQRNELVAKSQKRLAEYRRVAAELNGHQSGICRRIVPSGIKYLFDSTTEVDDSSERAFEMVLENARISNCL